MQCVRVAVVGGRRGREVAISGCSLDACAPSDAGLGLGLGLGGGGVVLRIVVMVSNGSHAATAQDEVQAKPTCI